MNEKRNPPPIATAVCTSGVALCSSASCFAAVKSAGAGDFLVLISILVSPMMIALAVLQWVLYFRGYVDFQIDQLRQESSSND